MPTNFAIRRSASALGLTSPTKKRRGLRAGVLRRGEFKHIFRTIVAVDLSRHRVEGLNRDHRRRPCIALSPAQIAM